MRQIDYDSFSKEAIQKEHKEHMEKIVYQLIHGHPKPSIYYPIVVEAWERFRNK
jgi:hypothetical protein